MDEQFCQQYSTDDPIPGAHFGCWGVGARSCAACRHFTTEPTELIDFGKPVPGLTRCPDCGKPWIMGETFYAFCGDPRICPNCIGRHNMNPHNPVSSEAGHG